MERRLDVHIFWEPHHTPRFLYRASAFHVSSLTPKFRTLPAETHSRKLYCLSCKKIAYFIAFIFRRVLSICLHLKNGYLRCTCVTCFVHLISTFIDSNIDRGSTVLWEQSIWADSNLFLQPSLPTPFPLCELPLCAPLSSIVSPQHQLTVPLRSAPLRSAPLRSARFSARYAPTIKFRISRNNGGQINHAMCR